ncbi:MAG TPA: PTS sugar transporter subunit IIA [Phycisphaerales bacterium]|nr:PTS sugar transporter subunit IIA [Phycisphaerales bacterium]
MKLCDLVTVETIVPRLSALERDAALNELFDALVAAKVVKKGERDILLASVLEREKKGSTGFGKGVAVPHVKHASIKKMAAAVGTSASGIDFNALDKQPVYSVFLLLSPAEKPEEHLQAMETIFKNLSQDKFRRFLRQAETAEDIWGVLDDADHQRLGT